MKTPVLKELSGLFQFGSILAFLVIFQDFQAIFHHCLVISHHFLVSLHDLEWFTGLS
jgi:hypothetical protein